MAEIETGRADPLARAADVIVIGSGPVGLKLALDLADEGIEVLLIESGAEGLDPAAQALGAARIRDPGAHASMDLATRRGLGGTSALWGGRAVPFDPVDVLDRDHVPEARWPIGPLEIEPWYETACRFLDCGPADFSDPWPFDDAADGLVLDRIERWCAEPNMAKVHGARVRRHPLIRLALATTATRLVFDEAGGAVDHVEVARGGERREVRARAVVVAAGGLETTRLLLASRRDRPALFGGPEGALGRYYMGHVFGAIADITFARDGLDGAFLFRTDASGRYVRRRFTFDARTQVQSRLLNAACWPELPPLHDQAHGSGILSLAYLALAAPILGRRLSPEAIRRRKIGDGPVAVVPHATNLIRDAIPAARFAAGFLKARYFDAVRMPGFFVTNPGRTYEFHVHAEQAPNAASRVTLGTEVDALGMPRLDIDLRFTNEDAASAVATTDLMAEKLASAGIAMIRHRHPPEERVAAVLAQASDGFHQIGTARMAEDPRRGVVDGRCRVHGVSNLFLAGSAVFPSSGQANPTLLAVALSARLGAHLRETFRDLG